MNKTMNKETPRTKKPFNWVSGIFLIGYHLALLIVLPWYFMKHSLGAGMIISSIVLLYATGMSITAGYHRLFSHRAYKANGFVEFLYLFFGAMAVQGSALIWCYDHRRHHNHVDTNDDPYNINRGFWYAHCLWLFEKPNKIEPRIVRDLLNNKMLVHQHENYGLWAIASNVVAVLVLGAIFSDFAGAIVIGWLLRMFALHHFTWFINSLAHMWGSKTFSQEHTAVDNWAISMLTFGEGYHNYHHTFATDYRNGIKWYNFDPTKWLIWGLNKLGFTKDLHRVKKHVIKTKMVLEDKRLLLETLKDFWKSEKPAWEKSVNELSEQLLEKFSNMEELLTNYQELKKKAETDGLASLKKEIESLKSNLQEDWNNWLSLCKNVMKGAPQHQHVH